MLLCLFLIISKLIIAPWEVAAITNKRPSIATTEYSGNLRYFRQIAAGPSSGQLGDWEIGLREAILQALLREGYWEPNLRERLTNAQLIGRRDQATPFGDVAILARGQLYNIQPGNFMLLQDSYQNDCDDCYNSKRCERHDCQPYSPHNQEILVALWTVKRLRHRDRNGVRFEIEYIVSPINSNNNLIIMRRNRFNYAVPGHVFVIRNDRSDKKYSEVFNRKVPKNNFRQDVTLGIDSEGYKKILYSYPGFYTSIPSLYLPPVSDDREAILYKKLLEVLSSKTTTTQKQDDVFHTFPTTTKPLPNVQEEIPAAIAPTTPTTSTTTSATEISTLPPKTTMKTIITYFMPFGDEIFMPQSDITTDTTPSTRATTTSTSTIRTFKPPTTSTITKITTKKPRKTTFSTTLMPKTSTSTTTYPTTSTKKYYASKQTKTTTKKPTKTRVSTTVLPKTTASTRKPIMLTTKYVQTSTSRTTSTSSTSKTTSTPSTSRKTSTTPSTTKLKPTKSTSSSDILKTTSYTVISKPPPLTSLFTKLTTLPNPLITTTTKPVTTIISQVPLTEITTMALTNAPSLLTTEYQISEENITINHTIETITPFTIMLTTTEPPSEEDIAFEMSTIQPTEPMLVQSVTPSTEIALTNQTTDANIENSKSTFTPLESSPITSSEFTTPLPGEVITFTMEPTDQTTETTISLSTTTSESPPTTNLPTTTETPTSMVLTTTEASTTRELTTIEAPTEFEITTITQKTTTPSDFLTETEPYSGPVYVGSPKNDYSLDDIFGPTTPTTKSTTVSTVEHTESDISQQLFSGNLPQDSKIIFSNFYEASTDKNEDNIDEHEFSTSQSYETSIRLEVNKRNLGESSMFTKKVTKNRAFTINQNRANLKKNFSKNKLLNIDKNNNSTNSIDAGGMMDISNRPVEDTMSINSSKNEPLNKTNIIEKPTRAEVVKMQTNMSDFVVYKAEYPNELDKTEQKPKNQVDILDDLALRLINHAKSLEYSTKSNNTVKVPKYKRKPYVPRSKRPANKRNDRTTKRIV